MEILINKSDINPSKFQLNDRINKVCHRETKASQLQKS